MKLMIVTGTALLLTAHAANAEWVKYYKNKSDKTVYYYNDEKLVNSGGIVTVWTKTDDSYAGKYEIDCQKSTFKTPDRLVKDIAPDTMMEALAQEVCENK